MDPQVSGEAVTMGQVGAVPLNQPRRVLRANVEYRPPFLPGFSFDVALSNFAARAAARDNLAWVEPYTLADLGLRYRFSWKETPAAIRVQVANVADTFSWNVVGSNSYGLTDGRRVAAYLAVDL
jgi:iron complex outermembrane receptor protein